MTPKERDDFIFKVQEMADVYEKKLSKNQESVWLRVVGQYGVGLLEVAIQRHYEEGRFMPKPSEIRSLIKLVKAESKSREKPASEPEKKGSKTLAKAWLTYMKFAYDFEGPGYNENTTMDIDKVLDITNRHCQHEMNGIDDIKIEVPDWAENSRLYIAHERTRMRQVIFDSVKDEHKLPEYW